MRANAGVEVRRAGELPGDEHCPRAVDRHAVGRRGRRESVEERLAQTGVEFPDEPARRRGAGVEGRGRVERLEGRDPGVAAGDHDAAGGVDRDRGEPLDPVDAGAAAADGAEEVAGGVELDDEDVADARARQRQCPGAGAEIDGAGEGAGDVGVASRVQADAGHLGPRRVGPEQVAARVELDEAAARRVHDAGAGVEVHRPAGDDRNEQVPGGIDGDRLHPDHPGPGERLGPEQCARRGVRRREAVAEAGPAAVGEQRRPGAGVEVEVRAAELPGDEDGAVGPAHEREGVGETARAAAAHAEREAEGRGAAGHRRVLRGGAAGGEGEPGRDAGRGADEGVPGRQAEADRVVQVRRRHAEGVRPVGGREGRAERRIVGGGGRRGVVRDEQFDDDPGDDRIRRVAHGPADRRGDGGGQLRQVGGARAAGGAGGLLGDAAAGGVEVDGGAGEIAAGVGIAGRIGGQAPGERVGAAVLAGVPEQAGRRQLQHGRLVAEARAAEQESLRAGVEVGRVGKQHAGVDVARGVGGDALGVVVPGPADAIDPDRRARTRQLPDEGVADAAGERQRDGRRAEGVAGGVGAGDQHVARGVARQAEGGVVAGAAAALRPEERPGRVVRGDEDVVPAGRGQVRGPRAGVEIDGAVEVAGEGDAATRRDDDRTAAGVVPGRADAEGADVVAGCVQLPDEGVEAAGRRERGLELAGVEIDGRALEPAGDVDVAGVVGADALGEVVAGAADGLDPRGGAGGVDFPNEHVEAAGARNPGERAGEPTGDVGGPGGVRRAAPDFDGPRAPEAAGGNERAGRRVLGGEGVHDRDVRQRRRARPEVGVEGAGVRPRGVQVPGRVASRGVRGARTALNAAGKVQHERRRGTARQAGVAGAVVVAVDVERGGHAGAVGVAVVVRGRPADVLRRKGVAGGDAELQGVGADVDAAEGVVAGRVRDARPLRNVPVHGEQFDDDVRDPRLAGVEEAVGITVLPDGAADRRGHGPVFELLDPRAERRECPDLDRRGRAAEPTGDRAERRTSAPRLGPAVGQ